MYENKLFSETCIIPACIEITGPINYCDLCGNDQSESQEETISSGRGQLWPFIHDSIRRNNSKPTFQNTI